MGFIMMDFVSFLLVLWSLFLAFQLTHLYRKSVIGTSVVYFLIGTFFLGTVRIFLFLNESEIISVGEFTMQLGWHALHWLSTIAYLVAGKMLLGFEAEKKKEPSWFVAKMSAVGSLVFAMLWIIALPSLDGSLQAFEGGLIDRAGLVHFISFVLGTGAALYLLMAKERLLPAIRVIVSPLVVALGLYGISHFWELLTESWKVLMFDASFIEKVEQLITFPAYFFVAYGFYKSVGLIKKVIQ